MFRPMIPALAFAALLAPHGFGADAPSFGDDVAFMEEHIEIHTLKSEDGMAQVAVSPAYQGRVMTTTATGTNGPGYGWINRELIASGEFVPHINAFGGEDRFWLGPEGGQFAIYFPPKAPFDLANWQTPAVIDSEPFELRFRTIKQARYSRTATITNYSGTVFDFAIRRDVNLLDRKTAARKFGVALPDSVAPVTYETVNRLTNSGGSAWKKDTGLLSIWILSMYKPSPDTTIVIPFAAGAESRLGPKVNDAYFGKVPGERLIVKNDVLYFSGDGEYRSKIGISPRRAKPIMGSYDAAGRMLTLVQYTLPEGATDYVNSMWELQEKPYGGDVVNSYNDGPPAPGKKPLGPFYELESSSPAAALEPKASITHVHRTLHVAGPEAELDAIARTALGVSLDDIKNAFK